MKMSDFVDEIEDCFENDLRDLGVDDDYEHWYEKRGGDPFLIFDAPNETTHGMNMKQVYAIFEADDNMTIEDAYNLMVKKPLLDRVYTIEKSIHPEQSATEEKEPIEVLEQDREMFFHDVV